MVRKVQEHCRVHRTLQGVGTKYAEGLHALRQVGLEARGPQGSEVCCGGVPRGIREARWISLWSEGPERAEGLAEQSISPCSADEHSGSRSRNHDSDHDSYFDHEHSRVKQHETRSNTFVVTGVDGYFNIKQSCAKCSEFYRVTLSCVDAGAHIFGAARAYRQAHFNAISVIDWAADACARFGGDVPQGMDAVRRAGLAREGLVLLWLGLPLR